MTGIDFGSFALGWVSAAIVLAFYLVAAERQGVAVVSFTETLPEGADYLSWMTDNLDAVATALA